MVEAETPQALREVRYENTNSFPKLLAHLNASLLVSTYQAGKLVTVGARDGTLMLGFANFERPMGIAIGAGELAIATKNQIWLLKIAPDVARQLDPPGTYDACYVARMSHFTGEIHAHEAAWVEGELCVVNTLFSCLCTLHANYSFVPKWRPPFITELAAEDRCHLNGLAVDGGRAKYVTALGETNSREGWREGKAKGGCLIDVASGNIVARGLSMPHSPRVHGGQVWLLDSGTGRLVMIDSRNGSVHAAAQLPGYVRGLSLLDRYAFVGLSKIRETSTFGGVPIAEQRDSLKCGVAAVDVSSGEIVGMLEFQTGVEEIFDVSLVPGTRSPTVRGPHSATDQASPIWIVPESSRTAR